MVDVIMLFIWLSLNIDIRFRYFIYFGVSFVIDVFRIFKVVTFWLKFKLFWEI